MRGFILAAGFGTRLRPITDHIPKALVPLAGKPLLQHAYDFLLENGITSIGANTHYLPEQVSRYCGAAQCMVELFHETPVIRGTGGALHFARRFFEKDAMFVVANVDIIARFDLQSQIRSFEMSNDCCRLLAWKNEAGTGTVIYDPADFQYIGAAHETGERSGVATADFIGITLYRREFLAFLSSGDFSILPVWRIAIDRGAPISVGLIDSGYWRDIGNSKSLAEAHFDIIDRRLDIAPPAHLHIDGKRRCCYPSCWSAKQAGRLGGYCWIGSEAFAPPATIERTLVFPGVDHSPSHSLRNVILTPWGEISFDE